MRAGRTARAGSSGHVTSIYRGDGPEGALATRVRAAVEAGDALEHVFSRRRSFRKRLKRLQREADEAAAALLAGGGDDGRAFEERQDAAL